MLVISRKKDQTVVLGDSIEIKVLATRNEQVKLGIVAPGEVAVLRGELVEQVRQQNLASLDLDTSALQGFAKKGKRRFRAPQQRVFRSVARRMVHDIRNVMTSIRGELELAQLDCTEPLVAESLMSVLSNSDRLLELLKEISEASGRVRMGAPTCLDHVLADWSSRALNLFENLELEFNNEAKGAEVPASVPSLQMILMELTKNAVESGSPRLKVEVTPDGGMLKLVVRDWGHGFDDLTKRRATEPYYSTRAGKKGLGLSKVENWLFSFGGDLSIESELGKGTKLHLTFDPRIEYPIRKTGLAILIGQAGDETRLERQGYTVLLAKDAREAEFLRTIYRLGADSVFA